MKKTTIFTIASLCMTICSLLPQMASAQNWTLINSDQIYNYSNNTEGYITHQLWVDSLENLAEEDLLYFNRIAGICDTCENLIEGYEGNYYTNDYPQFLMKKAIQSDDYLWLQDSANIVIFPNAGLNESWLFDTTHNLTAEVTAITEEDIFGQTDSVKTISVDGREIKISKSFGIIEFPDYASEDMSYQLIGIESESNEYGYQRPDLLEFYDMEVGEGKMAYYDEGWPEHCLFLYDKITLTNKTVENDTITLQFDRIKYACNSSLECMCDPYDIENLQSYESDLTMKICMSDPHPATAPLNQFFNLSLYNYNTHKLNNCEDFNNCSSYSKIEANYHSDFGLIFGIGIYNTDQVGNPDTLLPHNTKLFDPTSNIFYDEYHMEGQYLGSYFADKLGLVVFNHFEFEQNANYHLKDWTDGEGNWVNLENHKTEEMAIFPNPADKKIYVTDLQDSDTYQIINMQGKYISDGQYSQGIDVSDLPSGLYLLSYLRDGNKVNHRFMKN